MFLIFGSHKLDLYMIVQPPCSFLEIDVFNESMHFVHCEMMMFYRAAQGLLLRLYLYLETIKSLRL